MGMRDRLGEGGLLSHDTRAVAVFEERGRTYRGINSKALRLLRYRIDGGMLKEGERCDFLMGVPKRDAIYFVELKGKNLPKAARQILSTIEAIAPRILDDVLYGRIVLSRIQRPDLRASDVIRLERFLARRGGDLKRECKTLGEEIS